MSKFIITYRLNTTNTYHDRYEKMKNYLAKELSNFIDDKTTATMYGVSGKKATDIAKELIQEANLIKDDNILITKIGVKVEWVSRIENGDVKKDENLMEFFKL